MAKPIYYPFYVRKVGTKEWKRLTDFGVTQNEKGVYYYSPVLGYAKPKLREFDTYFNKLYSRRTDGSHKDYLYQNALDFAISAEYEYCFGRNGTVIKTSPLSGSYQVVRIGNEEFHLVHTDRWTRNSGNFVPYEVLGRIANIRDAHLHIYSRNVKGANTTVRKLLLLQEDIEKPTKPTQDNEIEQLKARIKELEQQNKELQNTVNELKKKIEDAINILG